jgi:hypothetical protein
LSPVLSLVWLPTGCSLDRLQRAWETPAVAVLYQSFRIVSYSLYLALFGRKESQIYAT